MKILKFLAAAAIAIFVGNAANAQGIRFDAQVGWSAPQGEEFKNSAKAGLCYSLDLMFVPSFLNGQLSFGIAKDGNILFGVKKDYEGTFALDYSASKLGLVGGKIRFDLKAPVVKPYAAITLGVGRLKLGEVKTASVKLGSFTLTGNNDDEPYEYDAATTFAVKPELGVAFGWFTIGVGWMLPADYEVFNYEAYLASNHTISQKQKINVGTTQFNIGVAFKFGD
ncbi:MAG: hypothetical protein II939_16730 [Bacteroidales bacterium]|nr:hypothetical protein [Bacteroidales bacterium]